MKNSKMEMFSDFVVEQSYTYNAIEYSRGWTVVGTHEFLIKSQKLV